MAILETNYDRVENEKFYKEIKPKKIEVPDNLVDILTSLSYYCDIHTLPDSDYCLNCPFYTGENSNNCIVRDSGYGIPHEWVVYKKDAGGDTDASD